MRKIVWLYADMVFGVCDRILRDAAAAQDATQETFLRLLRKPTAVHRSLGGWLHQTATRIANDAVRSDASRREREAEYAAARPTQVSEWESLSPLIVEVLYTLPEDQRTLLVSHFLLGKSQRELMAEWEKRVSPATMSRRIKEALEALRTGLGKKGVVIGGVILLSLLEDRPAQAAPPRLTRELGKMAMVSGAISVARAWPFIKFLAAAAAVITALVFGSIWAIRATLSSSSSPDDAPHAAAISTPTTPRTP